MNEETCPTCNGNGAFEESWGRSTCNNPQCEEGKIKFFTEEPKVTLPKEVAEAIDKAWNPNIVPLVKHLSLTNWKRMRKSLEPKTFDILLEYCKIHPIEYMTALVNGYTVEQTKEERLLEIYKNYNEECEKILGTDKKERFAYCNGVCWGILESLDVFGITIPGINGEENK